MMFYCFESGLNFSPDDDVWVVGKMSCSEEKARYKAREKDMIFKGM